MTPLDAAISYARTGRRIFPARNKNSPRVSWPELATTDEKQIRQWWERWPCDLVCSPTGEIDVVLDVDPPAGIDALEELGWPFWFCTPTCVTPRGLHAHFAVPHGNIIRTTTGTKGRGIGIDLDWRGAGGFTVLPSPGSGYYWDPGLNLENTPLIAVPSELLPRDPVLN
jgi:hypothetical protein